MGEDYQTAYPTWATVYTDASFHEAQGGGWAAWVRYTEEPRRVIANGVCPPGTKDAVAAELRAIIEGVRLALATWSSIEGIGVRSDCKGALQMARECAYPKPRRPDIAEMQRELWVVLRHGAVRLRCIWVRGHQGKRSVQGYLNDQVDTRSRDARLKQPGREGSK